MRKSKMIYPQKPSKESEESSPSSRRETDRLETQHVALEKISVHRRNPSQLLYQQHFKGLPRPNQKENVGPIRCSLQGTCSLLTPSPLLAFNKAPLEGNSSEETHVFSEASLAGQSLSRLPRAFALTHAGLRMLDLRDNKFADFPAEVLGLTGLRILRLDGNFIKQIPSNISQLSSLQILTLSKNKLKRLDPSVMKLAELSALAVNENALEEWPEWLAALPKLKLLHIQGNYSISAIPLTVGYMHSLGELGFDWLCYILPNGAKTVKSQDKILGRIKELCRSLQEEHENYNIENDFDGYPRLRFTEFMQHFKDEERFIKGRTALHMASIWGHVGVVKDITSEMEPINVKDNDGFTPLILAIKYGKADVVDALLAHPNTRVSENTEKYGTALHLAILKGWWELCGKLIKHPTFEPNAKDCNGNTALHLLFAIFEQDVGSITKLAKELLKNSECNPNEINFNELAPLHYAAKKNQRNAIYFVLEMNRVNDQCFDLLLPGGKQGFTVLHFLVIYSDIEVINDVLKSGVDVFTPDATGRTAREIVRNSIIGRLLLRYEKAARRNALQRNVESESFTGRESSGNRLATHPDVCIYEGVNRATLSNKKEYDSDLDESNGDEYDSPIKLAAYTTTGPLMFEEIHKMNVQSENICDYSQVQIQVHNSPLFELNPARIHSTTLAGHFNNETKNDTGGDTERMLGATFKRPSLAGELGFGNTLKCPTKEDRIWLENRFSSLYESIINSTVSKPVQYRYLYHMFQKYISESEEILLRLCEKLKKGNPLKVDIVYLLSMLKSKSALPIIASINPKAMPVCLNHELLNAKPLAKQRKNYLPVKYESKQQRQEGLRASLLSQTQHGFGKGLLTGFSGTALFGKKGGSSSKAGLRQIPSFSIRKTLNYFIN